MQNKNNYEFIENSNNLNNISKIVMDRIKENFLQIINFFNDGVLL